jgi:Legume lectin domain
MLLKVTPLYLLFALSSLPSRECAAASFTAFQDPSGLILQADAAVVDNTILRLTPAKKSQRGGVWLGTKQAVDTSFDTTFQFRITEQCNYGGNGFSFVIQNNPTPVLGGFGHNGGFWGASNLVAVNFRTYHYSGTRFVKFDEISVIAGDMRVWSRHCTNCVASVTNVIYSDHAAHTARITYAPGEVSVFLDDLSNPILTAAINLAEKINLDNGKAWVGFTAATGGDCENHDLLSWFFNETTSASASAAQPGKQTLATSAPEPTQAAPVFASASAPAPVAALAADRNPGSGLALPPDVGLTHDIEVSTDLVHWTRTTNVMVYFKDGEATNYDHRFYRFRQR